jgi:hypothetical protein
MNANPDRLYELLPVVYRLRDAEQGYPLRGLLAVITEQVNLVEADITQLYENWFIETCQDWVVPYIGDLIGYTPVHEAGEPGDVTEPGGAASNLILIPRREVANTIQYRRRKGTLALLEELAMAVARWPARAVEFFRLLGVAQNINYLHMARGFTADLRDGDALDLIDSPFDELAHTVDVRRINSHRAAGRYNIPSVGVFVWRLKSYSVTKTPAYCLEDVGPQCFTFSVLGNDTQLFNRPEPENKPANIAGELNLPVQIRRRAFEQRLQGPPPRTQASADYYGEGKSLLIWAPGWPGKSSPQPIPRKFIKPADLTGWRYRAPRNYIAVDPKLGRIVFPPGQLPKQGVRVFYHYGFSADIGGGEYDRPISQPKDAAIYRVGAYGDFPSITEALDAWTNAQPKPLSAVVEITDSNVYRDQLNISLAQNENLEIRAAKRARPVIRLLDYYPDRPDAFSVTGKRGSRFTLDGLLITGRAVQINGPEPDGDNGVDDDLCSVTISHSTLVPGWGLHCDCEPKRPTEPSLELINTRARVVIEHSVVGLIQVVADEARRDPMAIAVSDSILDATHFERMAVDGAGLSSAYASLTIARCTVIGQILTHAIELAENSVFYGTICVARRQLGCMRFCYVTPVSRTPRRYECQPDLVEKAVSDKFTQSKGKMSPQERDILQEAERLRVIPDFNSTRYGTPTYCQLAESCADEIRRGADDESEMGVFHDLYQPQRAANLRARLAEYTPARMDSGIIYAT